MSTCNIIMLTCKKNVINMPDATYLCDTQLIYVDIRNMYVAKSMLTGELSMMTCEINMSTINLFMSIFT